MYKTTDLCALIICQQISFVIWSQMKQFYDKSRIISRSVPTVEYVQKELLKIWPYFLD